MRVFSGRLRLTWYLAEFAWNLFRQCRSEQSIMPGPGPHCAAIGEACYRPARPQSRDEENHFIVAQYIKVEALCEAVW